MLYDEYNELLLPILYSFGIARELTVPQDFGNSADHGITGRDSCLNTKLICINISVLFSTKTHKQLDCLHQLRIDFLVLRGIAVNTYKRYAFIHKCSYIEMRSL